MTTITLQLQSIRKAAERQSPASDEYVIKKRLLDTIYRQSQRINQLIDSMLDMTRLHSGALPLKFEEVKLSELVEDLIEDYRNQFRDAHCPLDVQIAAGIKLRGDAFRLEQVIVNLITNAIRYGSPGEVQIRLEKHEKTAIFTIQDSGPGIPLDYQKRIFDRYTRVEGVNDLGGLGIGLYIAREITEAHGGKISVKSEPGAGARFTLELPAVF